MTSRALHIERFKAPLLVTLYAVNPLVESLERESALSVVIKFKVLKVCLLVTA